MVFVFLIMNEYDSMAQHAAYAYYSLYNIPDCNDFDDLKSSLKRF